MSTERTVTLATSDHGNVTLTEPAWCIGHADHDPETARVDITHSGPTVDCVFLSRTLLSAEIVQSPFASPNEFWYGGRIEGVSVDPLGRTLTPDGMYSLAATLDGYADRLRNLADQLAAVLAGGTE